MKLTSQRTPAEGKAYAIKAEGSLQQVILDNW